MKKVYQYRYYGQHNGTPDARNTPGLTPETLASGSAFSSKMPILQLGVQGLPGTKVYINCPNVGDPVILGRTGIYELDLNDQSTITSLRIERASIERIDPDASGGYLLVDIIYEGEGA